MFRVRTLEYPRGAATPPHAPHQPNALCLYLMGDVDGNHVEDDQKYRVRTLLYPRGTAASLILRINQILFVFDEGDDDGNHAHDD